MEQAAETWVLASREKLHAVSPYAIARCDQVTGLIVERDAPAADLAPFEQRGLSIVRG
jgi:DeoR/GlpR family transcriptional regulator of sugar metabolism